MNVREIADVLKMSTEYVQHILHAHMQWLRPGESHSKDYSHGIIFIDYLEKRNTITGEYNVALLN